MKKSTLPAMFFLAASLVFCACAQAAEITVSAAASLTNAFTEIKNSFEKQHPGIKVVTNFAASNPLLKQIETGAPVDVFASADQATMNRAEEQKFIIKNSRVNFAANTLALIVPGGGENGLKGINELADKKYARIAIGNPDSVPAGRYAKKVLIQHGLWEELHEKFIMAENVRQVLDYVIRGEVQAGFVYGTDARQGGNKIRVVEELHAEERVTYPIAVLERSKHKKEAQAFVDFVAGPEGQKILGNYGFAKP